MQMFMKIQSKFKVNYIKTEENEEKVIFSAKILLTERKNKCLHSLSLIQLHGFHWWINVVEDDSVSTVTTEPLNVQMGHIWWPWKDEELYLHQLLTWTDRISGSTGIKQFGSVDDFGRWWMFGSVWVNDQKYLLI